MVNTAVLSPVYHFGIREVLANDIVLTRSMILNVLKDDLGSGYVPEWHWDLDQMHEVYIDNPRQTLLIAYEYTTGIIMGTTAVRTGGPQPPHHPQWIIDRYAFDQTAQLMRVYVARPYRRLRVARALVKAARDFILGECGYTTIYLHTNPDVPGAEAFWRSLPTTEIHDTRNDDDAVNTIHFELSMTAPID